MMVSKRHELPRVDAWVAERGRAFASVPLTAEEQAIVRKAIGRKRFRMRECFYNAMQIVLGDRTGKIRYVEGYRRSSPYALHGWAAINGKVIDVTVYPESERGKPSPRTAHEMDRWLKRTNPDRYLGTFTRGEGYRGVDFTRNVFAAACKLGGSTLMLPLLDDWANGYPALRGELDAFIVGGAS